MPKWHRGIWRSAVGADSRINVQVTLSRGQFVAVYVGLLLSIMLAALDQTIVSTALKSIVTDLGKQELVPWIGSAYLLTAAPLGTLYGKFADIFGRKATFIFAITMFEVGSALCGAATSMEFLIAARAVAGIGGGGIFALVLIIISDIVSMQDRGKYQGAIGAVFGLSSVIAPLLGGFFSDKVSWRWCFFINLPLGAVTLFTVVAFLNFPPPAGTIKEKLHRIDGLGALLLFTAIISMVTPLQLGGSVWAWNSPQVIALFAISPVLFAAFAYVELKVAAEPIIPASIFVNATVPAVLFSAFCLGATMLSGSYYLALFFQVVLGESSTQAGLENLPMVFGLVVLSITSGIWISRNGTYRHFFFAAPVIMSIGTGLLSTLNASSSLGLRMLFLFIFGTGVGSLIQVRIITVQAAVPRELIATANTLGGAVGVAITGTLLNNMMTANTTDAVSLNAFVARMNARGVSVHSSDVLELLGMLQAGAEFYPRNDTVGAGVYNATLANATSELIAGFNASYRSAYLYMLPYPAIIFVLAFFVKQFQMKAGGPGAAGGH
ncbi:major facilitator superfamily domain-containing protein [Chytriomyces sp. MP71]|nr:major facilitator superfamily domain-containing protein [Chytriomyces sp. MP71]